MKKAIEVLEKHIETISGIIVTAKDNPEWEKQVNRLSKERDELQTAIDHLKRKVKKDPRVDGLPTTEDKKSTGLFVVWIKGHGISHMGYYYHGWNGYYDIGVWNVQYSTGGAGVHKTDEILFYADPNEIV